MKKKTVIRVELSYPLIKWFTDKEYEPQLIKQAKKLTFKATGSGAGLGQRDLTFESSKASLADCRALVKFAKTSAGKKAVIDSHITIDLAD